MLRITRILVLISDNGKKFVQKFLDTIKMQRPSELERVDIIERDRKNILSLYVSVFNRYSECPIQVNVKMIRYMSTITEFDGVTQKLFFLIFT